MGKEIKKLSEFWKQVLQESWTMVNSVIVVLNK
jgi:hypothetical protein